MLPHAGPGDTHDTGDERRPSRRPDADAERSLVLRARSGDRRALAELVASHGGLVAAIARRYASGGAELEDLIACGTLGLLEAARRFDPDHDARFATYAKHWVSGRVRRHALANRRMVRPSEGRVARLLYHNIRRIERGIEQREGRAATTSEVAALANVAEEEVVEAMAALGAPDVPYHDVEVVLASLDTPEELVGEAEDEQARVGAVRRALDALDARERRVVEATLLAEEPGSHGALASELGVSRQRVAFLARRALTKLQRAVERDAAGRAPRRPIALPASRSKQRRAS